MDIGSTITGLGVTAVAGATLYDKKTKKIISTIIIVILILAMVVPTLASMIQ